MQHTTKVRDAGLLDLLVIAQLAEEYSEEAPQMKIHKVSIDTLMNNLAATIVSDEGYLRVMELDGKIIGGMWGLLTTMPWSDTKLSQDIILFIKKDYRGYGLPLIDDWVNWSLEKGASEVILSTASGIKTELFYRLMERKGFSLQGHTFSKEI